MTGQNNQNYFELFGLSSHYLIDLDDLKQRYYALHQSFHPDQQRSVLENYDFTLRAARVNEAYRTLSCPVKRATYLLSLYGFESFLSDSIQLSPDFLEKQMEFREQLSVARDETELKVLICALDLEINPFFERLSILCDSLPETASALKETLQALSFYLKLKSDAEERLWQH